MKVITTEEFADATGLSKLKMPGLARLLMEIMKINQVNDLYASAQPKQGPEFVDAMLAGCGVKIEFDEADLKNLPADGAFVAIANHPYGGIEGMVLLKILCMARPDSKVMANFILKKIPNLTDYFVAVNPFENIEHSSSISGIKSTLQLLADGTPIGIFPAGEVSTFQIDKQQVTDKLWHPVVGKIIAKSKVPVVPIYFHGNNGLLFNLLAMIHPTLRTAKLPSELFNKQGHTIKLRIGKPIDIKTVPDYKDPAKLLSFLRAKTYALGTGLEEEKKLFNPRNLFKIKKSAEDIEREVNAAVLEKEIETLRKDYLVNKEKCYEVFVAPTAVIPNIIREIGILRETTFRDVGEGSNKSIDIDEYDIYYHHLFIWDRDKKMIVGAYRIGLGDEIFYSMGKKGFYTASLFKIKSQFTPVLKRSLELGRSWIRKEYQKKPMPLFLLWKGILKFIAMNPRYRYLIGPVSISNSFSKFSKSLIVDYITRYHFDHEMAEYVKPRKNFKVDFSSIDAELLMTGEDGFKGLDNLISELEVRNMKVPVLLQKYISMNAKIICFNIDPKFADCLDGFLVLDLTKIPTDMMAKLTKNA